MLNTTLPSAHIIARSIPRCPTCNGRHYRYLAENTEDGFRLRDFSCEGCGADILEVYRRRAGDGAGAGHGGARQFLLVVLAALMLFLIIADGIF